MFQAKFFQFLFFGLVSSLSIYSHHFVGQASSSSRPRINSRSALAPPDAGKSHVLVTHGAGFVGAHVATALLEAGHAVTLADADAALYRVVGRLLTAGPRLKLAAADLSDATQLAAVLKRAQPAVDVVLQLQPANAEELAAADPLAWLSTNSMQLLSLLKAVNESSINKLVLASSYSVYTDQPSAAQLPTPGEPPACQPATAHGQAALFREAAVRSFAAARPGFRSVILRHSSVIGADRGQLVRLLDQSSSSSSTGGGGGQLGAISACLAAAVQGRQQPAELPVSPASDGSAAASLGGAGAAGGSADSACFREFVHVADLAAGVVAVIQGDCFGSGTPRVYNLGPQRALSHAEVLAACERLSGAAPQATQQLDGMACQARNISKLQADTGWRPQHDQEALADALIEATLEDMQQRFQQW